MTARGARSEWYRSKSNTAEILLNTEKWAPHASNYATQDYRKDGHESDRSLLSIGQKGVILLYYL